MNIIKNGSKKVWCYSISCDPGMIFSRSPISSNKIQLSNDKTIMYVDSDYEMSEDDMNDFLNDIEHLQVESVELPKYVAFTPPSFMRELF